MTNISPAYEIKVGDSPIVAAAIHNGGDLRTELTPLALLDRASRLREEDPFTADWARRAPTQIIGHRSRFEVDLNRAREKATYRSPQEAWGLNVWPAKDIDRIAQRSLKIYDQFYRDMFRLLTALTKRHSQVVVLDLHSYNHRRESKAGSPADPRFNPEVDIGTGSMDREFWAPLIDRLTRDLRAFDFGGRQLDVRENVKFRGGHFGRWIHQNFPRRVCAPAIEFKKTFMDEWTGEPDLKHVQLIGDAVESTFNGLLANLTLA